MLDSIDRNWLPSKARVVSQFNFSYELNRKTHVWFSNVTSILKFEGVCLTAVILTPGACGGRLRAAARETDSGDSGDSGDSDGSSGFVPNRAL